MNGEQFYEVTIKPRSKEFYERLEQFFQAPNSYYKPKEKLIDDDFNKELLEFFKDFLDQYITRTTYNEALDLLNIWGDFFQIETYADHEIIIKHHGH
jgi:hypothetical protein